MKKYALLFSFVVIEVFSEKSFFDDHARGWHWYERQKEKSRQDNNPQDAKISALQELKNYQQELEESKALAVLYPTAENVLNYQKKQYEMIQKSGKFAEVWMKNTYTNPDIDFTAQFPTSQNSRHIYLAEQRKKTEAKIRKLSEEYGLFFFFKNDCPYCEAFAPVVKAFSEKYSWEVLAISEFGEQHKLFSHSVQDNGLAEIWGVNTYPSLFAVNPKTGHVIPIAIGMISIQEMEERILSITKEDGTDEM